MELWIRSQNKEYFAKIDRVEVFDGLNNDWTIQSIYRVLGNYKTKERALEVLDEIQKRLIDTPKLEKYCCDKLTSFIIYEMPKE